METFESIARELHDERVKRERWEYQQRELTGENTYTWFCCWCNCFKDGAEMKKSAEKFGEFLKQEGIELNFWQKKTIAEKYFGYKYEYDYGKSKWNISKLARN